jgi:1,2-diacylglycerol 3-alpha-glucosyltransferase
MRIAMLTNNYLPFIGGVPISIKRLSEGLRSLGHEVYIFAPSYEGEEKDEYIIRYRTKNKKLSNGFAVPNFMDPVITKAFDIYSFDVIHVHHPVLIGYTALYLGKKYRIPVIYTYHTRYEQYLHYLAPYYNLQNRYLREQNKLLRQAEGKILSVSENKIVPKYIKTFTKHCDLVFAPTHLMKEHLINQGSNTEIKLLPTGLKETSFEPNIEEVIKIRHKYLGDNQFLFCTVSRLEREKNLSFLIRGMKELRKRYQDRFRLLILGDGTKREELEKEVLALGMEKQIIFVGTVSQDEITNYYKACDLFVFSSKSETQGIVLLEAMAVGLPVVAVKASGVNDIVKDQINGLTTEEDEKEFSGAIHKLLSNIKHYEETTVGANNTAREYSNETIAKKAEEHYTEAIIKKGEQYALKKWTIKNTQKDVLSDHSLIS